MLTLTFIVEREVLVGGERGAAGTNLVLVSEILHIDPDLMHSSQRAP